jgi:predicted NBD/HSP70 family sugar kinase
MKNVIGLDIGGTKIYAARFSQSYDIETDTKIPTEAKAGPEKVVANMITAIEFVKNKHTTAVGISWAGFVDADNGIIKKAPNIAGFEDYPLAEKISQKIGISVFIENDARLFALAEQQLDTSQPKVLLGIILGTGVGGGLILEGKVFHGAHNFAAEIGHTILDINENTEVEDLFAGPGLQEFFGVEDLRTIEAKLPNRSIQQKLEPRLKQMTTWLYSLCLNFDPDTVVLGGGAGQYFWCHFQEEITQRVNSLFKTKGYPLKLNLKISQLDNAGSIGAATLAFRLSKYI